MSHIDVSAWVTPTRRPARRPLSWLLVVCVVATLLSLGWASPAAAHGQLAMSQPAKDSTISEPLESVLLYYTEKPASNAHFTVTSPSGIRLDSQWSHAEPKQLDKPIQEYFLVNGQWEPRLYHVGFPVKVPVGYWPEQGLYTARYLSVASDGEEVRGELRFTYTGPATAAPAGWQARTNEADPALLDALQRGRGVSTGAASDPAAAASTGPNSAGDGGSGPGMGLWVWLIPAFVLIAVGIVVVRAGARPHPSAARSRAKAATKPRPAARPAAKPATKPGTKPAAKSTAKPATKPATTPATKAATKAASKPSTAEPAAEPAAEASSKTTAKPTSKTRATPGKSAGAPPKRS